MDATKKYEILRINEKGRNIEEDIVVVEYPLTIMLEGREIITLFCTPKSLRELTIGFLYSEGYITSMKDLEKVTIDEENGLAHVFLADKAKKKIKSQSTGMNPKTGSSKGTDFKHLKEELYSKRITNRLEIDEQRLMDLMRTFSQSSDLFSSTGGVHSCGLCDYQGIIFFEDDIGRHNAYDKIFGRALEQNIDLRDKFILTSGRISSEMLIKVIKRQIPMVVSKAAPMSLAVDMAKELNITLVGFVRGEKMNIYTNIPKLK